MDQEPLAIVHEYKTQVSLRAAAFGIMGGAAIMGCVSMAQTLLIGAFYFGLGGAVMMYLFLKQVELLVWGHSIALYQDRLVIRKGLSVMTVPAKEIKSVDVLPGGQAGADLVIRTRMAQTFTIPRVYERKEFGRQICQTFGLAEEF